MTKQENDTLPLPQGEEERFPLSCYDNRELSWLKFNQRVLEEAEDKENPLCEQMSFAAIFQSNLDEFFMVRVGSLHDQLPMNIRENKTGMTAQEQLDAVLVQVKEMLGEKDRIYAGLMNKLQPYGVEVLDFSNLNEEERSYLEKYFISEVQPLLSPQIVSPKQPFPFLNNKDIYAIISLKTKNGNERMGIVPCNNQVLRRLVPLPGGGHRYILMEHLILHFVSRIFERYRIVSKSLVRILRNADISIDDAMDEAPGSDVDYRRKMEKMLHTRRRMCAIKLEYQGNMDEKAVASLCKYLSLPHKRVFPSAAPLDLSFLFQLQDDLRDRKDLFYPRRIPQQPPCIDVRRPMMEQIKEKELLLAYPYESMEPFLRMLLEAVHDPEVVSIKMTLYRVARNSRVVDALCQAAENGKDVVVLVELRARFDEENNIGWSRVLEDAGCRIIYGLDGIKIHSKLCLITRKEGSEITYITQFGTGNYNEKTSKQYTDLSFMTASQELGREAAKVFNCLCMDQVVEDMEHLMVAPHCLRLPLCQRMDEEIQRAKQGEDAYIGIKCNSLTDKVLIDKLMEASQAGVQIELIVRGICCLISGIPGYTDNIRVISIVGRYLEHARIYLFGRGERGKVYISSADFMTRNTTRRVEVAAPIYAPELKERIREMFRIQMADNVKARVQMSDGTYQKRTVGEDVPLNAQEYFFAKAYEAAAVPLPAPIQPPPTEEPPKEEPTKEEPSQAAPEKEPTKEVPPVNPTQPAQ